jgi:hypothetical protein
MTLLENASGDGTAVLETGSARAQLQAAHQDLAGCNAAIARLKTTRQERTIHVAKLRATLVAAKDEAERIRGKAIADPSVVTKPGALIAAEQAAVETASETEFAADRLRRTEHELTAAEQQRNAVLREIRSAAQALAVEHATELALIVQDMERQALNHRVALRGLVAMLSGQGVRLEPVAVEVYRQEYPPSEPVVNSPEWRHERDLAQAWRAFIETALQDPEAELPTED